MPVPAICNVWPVKNTDINVIFSYLTKCVLNVVLSVDLSNIVKIVSVNSQGLTDPRKRRDVFHYLRQKSYSVWILILT